MAKFTAFIAISALVIVTPGQDTALTIRNTLFGGRLGGVFTALGVITGQLIWAVTTSAGLSTLVLGSQRAFTALKLAGAAYLAYLGARTLAAAIRRSADNETDVAAVKTARLATTSAAYRQGVISNLGNPKIAFFFTSLLPQFAGRDQSFVTLVSLGVVFATMTLIWLSAYAVAVAKVGDVLRQPRIRQMTEGLTGVVLIGLGLRLATEHR
jgi:threonine/homoserine/homoserine lactone efflux protein